MKKETKEKFESLGIEFVETPDQPVHPGLFALPPAFPQKELAAEWVPQDQVKTREQRTLMPGVGATVPGLTVWKGETGRDKPTVVFANKDKPFVLMCRPKKLQNAMNSLYGNVSKTYYNNEVKGETVAGTNPQDPGMLPESRLKEIGLGASSAEIEESLMALNRVPTHPEEAVPVET